MATISIIVPAFNEEDAIGETVHGVREAFDASPHECEIIVVDDASQDATPIRAQEAGARVISHPTNMGYGNALLTGIRNAHHGWIGITDADGTYPLDALPELLSEAEAHDYDMQVGARQGRHYHENAFKATLRVLFRLLCFLVVGHWIPDINSGLRVMRRDLVRCYAPVLSGGFSFTTSITIIAFQSGHHVAYSPIDYYPRKGRSHVKLLRDSLRALQIIVMTIVLFNPIKLFLFLCLGSWAAITVSLGLLIALPNAIPVAMLIALGGCTTAMLLGMGFLAIRHQMGLGEIGTRQRGYVPRARAQGSDYAAFSEVDTRP